MFLLKICFLYAVITGTYSDEFKCNVCTCYYAEPTTFMDCSGLGLDWLPELVDMVTYSLTTVFINGNNVTILDEVILDEWSVLEYIDIRNNPLQCDELKKIQPSVTVLSDCHPPTDGKYTHLYILVFYCLLSMQSANILNC